MSYLTQNKEKKAIEKGDKYMGTLFENATSTGYTHFNITLASCLAILFMLIYFVFMLLSFKALNQLNPKKNKLDIVKYLPPRHFVLGTFML